MPLFAEILILSLVLAVAVGLAFHRTVLPQPSIHRTGMTYDAIVVLGCRSRPDGTPGFLLGSRIDKGIVLFRTGAAPRIIMTGAAVHSIHVEAEVMVAEAIRAGIDRAALVLEPKARNTRENVYYTANILRERGWKHVLVVTSSFHLRRAAVLFRLAGLDAHMAAAPTPRAIPWNRRLLLRLWEWYLLTRIAWTVLLHRTRHR